MLSLTLLGPVGPLVWLVLLTVEYPVVFVVFMMCWMFGVDVDESVKGAAYRLLAAIAAADAILFALAVLPIPLVSFVGSAMAFIGFLTFVFEMEWGEAMLVGFSCVIAKTIVTAALFLWFAGML
ncbi:MAG: hypothetical protein KDA28_17475 [Phycisphaerales bacterium]|nr:hypothetical protein [Phycisphaerales bacterium]